MNTFSVFAIINSRRVFGVDSIIGYMTRLKELNLRNNYRTDISTLKALKNLECLDVSSMGVPDISVIKHFKKLTELDIGQSQVKDISVLEGLTNLKILNLAVNKITNIHALSNMIKLKELKMEANEISDISPLKELKELENVQLAGNPIKKLPVWLCDFPKMEIQWKKFFYGTGYITFYNEKILPVSPPKEIISLGKGAVRKFLLTPGNDQSGTTKPESTKRKT